MEIGLIMDIHPQSQLVLVIASHRVRFWEEKVKKAIQTECGSCVEDVAMDGNDSVPNGQSESY